MSAPNVGIVVPAAPTNRCTTGCIFAMDMMCKHVASPATKAFPSGVVIPSLLCIGRLEEYVEASFNKASFNKASFNKASFNKASYQQGVIQQGVV